MKPFDLAWLHLFRERGSSLLALFAIALSVAGSSALLRLDLLSQSRFQTIDTSVDAVVGAKASSTDILMGALNGEGAYAGFLPYKLFESLRARASVQFEDGTVSETTSVKKITPLLFFARAGAVRVAATDSSFLDGRSLSIGKWPENPFEVVIGSKTAEKLRLGIGQPMAAATWTGDTTEGQPVPLKVVGILTETDRAWDLMAFANLPTAWQVLKQENLSGKSIWGEQVLQYFLIHQSEKSLAPLQSLIDQRTVAQIIDVPREISRLEELLGSGENLGLMISALILSLAALTVIAVLSIRFQAIESQMAVLRALGYLRSEILRWLLWEGILLGLGAGILGFIIESLMEPFLRQSLAMALPHSDLIRIPWFASWPVWAASVLATTLAALAPYIVLQRKSIHDSLRAL